MGNLLCSLSTNTATDKVRIFVDKTCLAAYISVLPEFKTSSTNILNIFTTLINKIQLISTIQNTIKIKLIDTTKNITIMNFNQKINIMKTKIIKYKKKISNIKIMMNNITNKVIKLNNNVDIIQNKINKDEELKQKKRMINIQKDQQVKAKFRVKNN